MIGDKKFLRYKHKETGEEIVIEANEDRETYLRLKRARCAARKFANYIQLTGGDISLYHITLTQAVEGFYSRYLDSFIHKMKYRYKTFYYFWTSEIQQKRLEDTGDAVLHWHLIVAVSSNEEIDQEVVARLWGHGFVWVSRVNNRGILTYLLKYITKDGEYFNDKGARKFGGCRVPSVYSLTLRQLRLALERVHYDFSVLESYVWSGGRGFMQIRDVIDEIKGVFGRWRNLKMIDVSFRSQYELVFEFWSSDAVPF